MGTRSHHGFWAAALAVSAILFGPAAAQTVETARYIEVDSQNRGIPQFKYDSASRNIVRSPCGSIAWVYKEMRFSFSVRLIYLELDPAGVLHASWVEDYTSGDYAAEEPGSVVFDSACRAHIFRPSGAKLYHYAREGTSFVRTEFDWAQIWGQNARLLFFHSAILGGDGAIWIFYDVILADNSRRTAFARQEASGWSHRQVTTDLFSQFDVFNFQVDAAGAVHLVHNFAHSAGDFSLYYAKQGPAGWVEETIASNGGDIDIQYHRHAFLALKPDGAPGVIGTFEEHYDPGGSLKDSDLVYFSRNSNGTWSKSTLQGTADGYTGTDGNNYTGAEPQLAFDLQGRPHVVFCDIASWHEPLDIGGGQTVSANVTAQGQIRYAYHNGSQWKFWKIFSQLGQSQSPDPIYELFRPQLAISPGGSEIGIIGMERQTTGGSPQFYPDRPQEFKLHFFRLTNSAGAEPPPIRPAIIQMLLGLQPALPAADLNADTLVDMADALFAK